ncbi:hypothetical protein [Erwinia billingiae]|nr:hypothetical protein [Erwinia billingiae]
MKNAPEEVSDIGKTYLRDISAIVQQEIGAERENVGRIKGVIYRRGVTA